MLFRDDFSRFCWLYLTKTKKQTVNALERFLADVKLEGTVDVIRSDNGGEILGDFSKVCDAHCIKRECVNANTPEVNGSVERSLAILDHR